ncbi:MAG: hypothetical protein H6R00_1389 [Proteobacteria bacterium]|nr:hypothetical protein [Pseudomonadota bacterium]
MTGFLRPPCQRAHKSGRIAEGLDVEAVTHQPVPQPSEAAFEWFDRNQSVLLSFLAEQRSSASGPAW